MIVLPPQKYTGLAQQTAAVPGMPQPSNETNNVLKHPTGTEHHLVVGEGTYKLRDDWFLSTPPPHPSEAPVINLNPLATTVLPPLSGTKLSLMITSGKRGPPQLLPDGEGKPDFGSFDLREGEKDPRSSHDTASTGSNPTAGNAPAFGANNTLLQALTSKDSSKKKKPKSNIIKTNSTFISRVIPHESLQKRLQDRDPDCLFAFANINRAFQWIDLTSNITHKSDHLCKILFTKAHILCHDVNHATKGSTHLDVVMGSSAADLIWYEPHSQRYHRINKNGAINSSPVSDVKWMPGSENLFLASHMDGTLIVYDKEREDGELLPEEVDGHTGDASGFHTDSLNTTLAIRKSVNSTNQKHNPVASWKISNQKINSFQFSPDCRHLAVVSEDGSLRIIDYLKESLLDLYTSYYGGLTCLCWSPDGKYIVTGGQDDLVSIWSLADRCIIARCAGHHSWVTWVAFDPWRCDGMNYRFGSVGEDCKLLLWDFNMNMLHRPRAGPGRQRGVSVSSVAISHARQRSENQNRLRSNSSLTTTSTEADQTIEHAVESRLRTADLPPVLSKSVDIDPLSWVGFQEDCIITACIMGHIKIWDRPKENTNPSSPT